jgi:hypothetical protein
MFFFLPKRIMCAHVLSHWIPGFSPVPPLTKLFFLCGAKTEDPNRVSRDDMLFNDLAYLRPKLGIEDSVAGLGLANFTKRNLGSEGAHEGESYHEQVHDWDLKNRGTVGFALPRCTFPSAKLYIARRWR